MEGIELIIASDVKNPFVGKEGAVATFSTQKGASKEDQIVLEKGMNNIVQIFQKENQIDLSNLEFSGAAGVTLKKIIFCFFFFLFYSYF